MKWLSLLLSSTHWACNKREKRRAIVKAFDFASYSASFVFDAWPGQDRHAKVIVMPGAVAAKLFMACCLLLCFALHLPLKLALNVRLTCTPVKPHKLVRPPNFGGVTFFFTGPFSLFLAHSLVFHSSHFSISLSSTLKCSFGNHYSEQQLNYKAGLNPSSSEWERERLLEMCTNMSVSLGDARLNFFRALTVVRGVQVWVWFSARTSH